MALCYGARFSSQCTLPLILSFLNHAFSTRYLGRVVSRRARIPTFVDSLTLAHGPINAQQGSSEFADNSKLLFQTSPKSKIAEPRDRLATSKTTHGVTIHEKRSCAGGSFLRQ